MGLGLIRAPQATAETPNQGTSANVILYTFGLGQRMRGPGRHHRGWKEASTSEHQQVGSGLGPGGRKQRPFLFPAPAGPRLSPPAMRGRGGSCVHRGWSWNIRTAKLEVPYGSTTSTTHFSDGDFKTQRGTMALQTSYSFVLVSKSRSGARSPNSWCGTGELSASPRGVQLFDGMCPHWMQISAPLDPEGTVSNRESGIIPRPVTSEPSGSCVVFPSDLLRRVT